MHNIKAVALHNGLRIVFEPSFSPVVYCGYIMGAGARDEAPPEEGMAHFIEHMSFKGTSRRKAYHIANGLERVGGELNAFTGKQATVYTACALKEDFNRATDFLTDIVFHSIYPQKEINKEVEVICDEIDSYQDSPSELIFDEFESLLFKGSPLARDILGRKETLRNYSSADALSFARKHYTASNAVFYAYGNLSFDRIVRRISQLTSDLPFVPMERVYPPLPPPEPVFAERNRGTRQAHVVIGNRAMGGADERRFPFILLNNLLGGPGLNARLNQRVREKAGLVYTIESSYYNYPDAGQWSVYFGCDFHDVDKCIKMTHEELQRCIDERLTPGQLSAAKKQLKGQIGISADMHEQHALAFGKQYAHYGSFRDLEQIMHRIDEVTAEETQACAAEVFRLSALTTLIYK